MKSLALECLNLQINLKGIIMAFKNENPLTNRLIKSGGIANVVGGIFVAAAYLLHPPVPSPDAVPPSPASRQ